MDANEINDAENFFVGLCFGVGISCVMWFMIWYIVFAISIETLGSNSIADYLAKVVGF